MHRIFISDLHLDPALGDITYSFYNFLENEASCCDELYILGDLFNYWIGDGQKTPYQLEVAAHLAKVSAKKYFLPGNRDFMIGRRYAKRCKMQIIPDPFVISSPEPLLLCHGDRLCTLDLSYQKFLKFRSNPLYRFLYSLLPIFIKQNLADRVRSKAKIEKSTKDPKIMDVVDQDVFKIMENHHCNILIHGHTHKPFVHKYEAKGYTRIVLGDWNERGFDYLDERDGVLNLIHKPLLKKPIAND